MSESKKSQWATDDTPFMVESIRIQAQIEARTEGRRKTDNCKLTDFSVRSQSAICERAARLKREYHNNTADIPQVTA